MHLTKNAEIVRRIIEYVGTKLDAGTGRSVETKKLSRFVFANGSNIILQNTNLTPVIWLTKRDAGNAFDKIADIFPYESGDGKHSGLQQTSSFRGQELVRIVISDLSAATLIEAFSFVAS